MKVIKALLGISFFFLLSYNLFTYIFSPKVFGIADYTVILFVVIMVVEFVDKTRKDNNGKDSNKEQTLLK